jgi:hypothetical protein
MGQVRSAPKLTLGGRAERTVMRKPRRKFSPGDYEPERYRPCMACRLPTYRELLLCERCHRSEEQIALYEIDRFAERISREGLEKGSSYRFNGGLQSSIVSAYGAVTWSNRRSYLPSSSAPPMRMKPRND